MLNITADGQLGRVRSAVSNVAGKKSGYIQKIEEE
jgi:hypothetical protein